jgi:hypothetical protein
LVWRPVLYRTGKGAAALSFFRSAVQQIPGHPRRKLYATLAELQADLDAWMREYNEERTHPGRWCFGKTPMQTFRDSLPVAKEKMLAA